MTDTQKLQLIDPMNSTKRALLLKFFVVIALLLVVSSLLSAIILQLKLAFILFMSGAISIVLYAVIYVGIKIHLVIKHKHLLGKTFVKHYFFSMLFEAL